MNQGRNANKAILKTIARGEDRSPLFWWMVENHDRISAAAGRRIHWKGVCAEAAAHGLTDAEGKSPSEATARQTWRRARQAVAEGRQRESAAPSRVGAKPPSRLSKEWRPQELTPAAHPPAVASPSGAAKAPYDPQKALAPLDRIMNERSGRRS